MQRRWRRCRIEIDGRLEAAHRLVPLLGFHRLHAARVLQPGFDRPRHAAVQRRLDAAAAMMAADHDVGHLQHVHRILQHGQQVQVVVMDQVGDVAVDEHQPGQRLRLLFGADAAVRTADPQELRTLPRRLPLEEVGLLVRQLLRPGAVGEQQLLGDLHAKRTSVVGASILGAVFSAMSPRTSTSMPRYPAFLMNELMMSMLSRST